MRSRFRWSITAISRGPRRLTRSFVRRPRRAVPWIAVAVAIAIAGSLVLRRLEKLPGVLVRRLVAVVATEHPDDLRDQALAVHALDLRDRLAAVDALLDPEVALGHRRDLRQVGD